MFAAVVLAAGCSGGGDTTVEEAAPSTTSPAVVTTGPTTTEPPITTTTEPVDPFAVPSDPADIDPAYVERVINEHNRIIGDALRIELAGGDAKEIVDRYNAVYVPQVANELLTGFFQMAPDDLSVVREEPGNRISSVERLTDVAPECVIAVVAQDFRAVRIDAPEPVKSIVLLRRAGNTAAVQQLNVTGWLSEGAVAMEDAPSVTC